MKIGGKTVSGKWLLAGGAGLAGAFLLYRHFSSSSSSASSASSSSAIDPVTGLPYSMDSQTDPATGLTYLAEAQQYGSVAAAEAAVSGQYGAAGGPGTGGTSGWPSGWNPGTPSPTGTSYATNAQWASAVQAGLVGIGYAATDIAAALGLFFAQQPLPANYAQIIQVAEAEYGPPPQGTYVIIPQPGGGPPGGGAPGPVAGLSASGGQGSITGRWTATTGASSYTVTLSKTGAEVQTQTVTATTATFTGLAKDTSYGVHVAAVNSAGTGPAAVAYAYTSH